MAEPVSVISTYQTLISIGSGVVGIIIGAAGSWLGLERHLSKKMEEQKSEFQSKIGKLEDERLTFLTKNDCKDCHSKQAETNRLLEESIVRTLSEKIDIALGRIAAKYDAVLKTMVLKSQLPDDIKEKIIQGL